ncbi:MAG TPA: translation elongation factor Ts [Terriglobales bacterium]|nr:translation elongation factor Ts [Terriglobales bacterium]
MAKITAETVKLLREQSGAGVMECKRALEETDGDLEKAAAVLRERGQAAAVKRAGREANQGQVSSYIHTGGKIGVLIEVNCETDFVARTDEFQRLVKDLAIQVAGLRPQYTTIESIPAEVLEAKRAELLADEVTRSKPESVRGQIIDGQLKKWFAEVVLVEQTFRDQDRTVGALIAEAIAKTGENMRVRRFVRYELGE